MEKHGDPSNQPRYEVVWPLSKSRYEAVTPGRRTTDLSHKTIGFVWDWFFKGDQMFDVLRERLSERFPGVKFVDYNVFGSTHGRNEREVIATLPEKLRQHGVDLVISGVGA